MFDPTAMANSLGWGGDKPAFNAPKDEKEQKPFKKEPEDKEPKDEDNDDALAEVIEKFDELSALIDKLRK